MDRLAMAAQYSPSGGALVRRAIRPSRLIEREGVTSSGLTELLEALLRGLQQLARFDPTKPRSPVRG